MNLLSSPGRQISKDDFQHLKKRLTSNLGSGSANLLHSGLDNTSSKSSLTSKTFQIAENQNYIT
jgi:hypothetical protein